LCGYVVFCFTVGTPFAGRDVPSNTTALHISCWSHLDTYARPSFADHRNSCLAHDGMLCLQGSYCHNAFMLLYTCGHNLRCRASLLQSNLLSCQTSALLHMPSLGLHTMPTEVRTMEKHLTRTNARQWHAHSGASLMTSFLLQSVWISVHAFLAVAAVYPVCTNIFGMEHKLPMSPVGGACWSRYPGYDTDVMCVHTTITNNSVLVSCSARLRCVTCRFGVWHTLHQWHWLLS